MTETNCKQDIITNGSEENTKQQQPDMAERQPCLKRVAAGKTPDCYGEWQPTEVWNVHFMYVWGILFDLYT